MANILHLAQSMEEELHGLYQTVTPSPTPPISAFVAAARISDVVALVALVFASKASAVHAVAWTK
jgi:hypothetical protein